MNTVDYMYASREAQLEAELDAVDKALGEFCVPAYQDHGVHILRHQYERVLKRIKQLEALLDLDFCADMPVEEYECEVEITEEEEADDESDS